MGLFDSILKPSDNQSADYIPPVSSGKPPEKKKQDDFYIPPAGARKPGKLDIEMTGIFTFPTQITALAFMETAEGPVLVTGCLDDGTIRVMKLDGTPVWEYDYGGSVNTIRTAVIGGEICILAGIGKKVLAISPAGALKWTYEIPDVYSVDSRIQKIDNPLLKDFMQGVQKFGGAIVPGEEQWKFDIWGVLTISTGVWNNEDVIIASAPQIDVEPHVLGTDGKRKEIALGNMIFASFLSMPPRSCIAGIGIPLSMGFNFWAASVPVRVKYMDGKEAAFNTEGCWMPTQHLITRMKPRQPFATGVLGGKPAVITGNLDEGKLWAHSFDGKKLWSAGLSAADALICNIAGSDLVAIANLAGAFQLFSETGQRVFEDDIKGGAVAIAHTEWNGASLFAVGMLDGRVLVYVRGDMPLEAAGAATAGTAEPAEATKPPATPEAGQVQAPAWKQEFCTSCGQKYENPRVAFCSRCGAKRS